MRASFYGHSVAVIGNRATDRGSMQVYINGKLQKTVDTAGATKDRVVIYQKRFRAHHERTIKPVAATSARVDVDGFIVSQ